MNLKTEKLDNVFLGMIFGFIKKMSWQSFDLRVRFKGRVIDREKGGGFEAREFKVSILDQNDIEYISPREQAEIDYGKKLDMQHKNRLRGGEKTSRYWKLKRLRGEAKSKADKK